MKSHAKRAIKHLESIGFTRDETASNPRKGKFVFRHPNAPDRPLKVFSGETDTTSTTVMKLGEQIAGLQTSGPTVPSTIRERVRIKKATARQAQRREDEARRERAVAAEAAFQKLQSIGEEEAHRREIERLMQPRGGR